MFDPATTLIVYSELGKALSAPLNVLSHFKDKDRNLLVLDFDFDPKQFDKSQQLQLLRFNAELQYCLEQLSAIIELVPYNFRHNNVSDPSNL